VHAQNGRQCEPDARLIVNKKHAQRRHNTSDRDVRNEVQRVGFAELSVYIDASGGYLGYMEISSTPFRSSGLSVSRENVTWRLPSSPSGSNSLNSVTMNILLPEEAMYSS